MAPKRKKKISEQVMGSADKKVERQKIDTSVLVPSGSTMLNLACANTPNGAFALGSINTIPGSSQGGKSILALTMLAECCYDEKFADYALVYDDTEFANHFDISYLFGKLSDRIKAPAYNKSGEPIFSNTIQDFKAHCQNVLSDGRPCIYVLDSLDSLSSDQEIEREYKAAVAKAKRPEDVAEIRKGFLTEKAKGINESLRVINGMIESSKSLLFMTQQERANLKTGFGQPEFSTSGGGAPYYYSTHQVWLKKGKTYTKEGMGQKRKIGHKTYAKVTKNKLMGKERDCEFDIYDDIGVDDVNSIIDFLKSTKTWTQKGRNLIAPELNFEGDRQDLIVKIDNDKNMYQEIKILAGNVWNEIEDLLKTKRARRFG